MQNKRILKTEILPDGWVAGKVKKKKICLTIPTSFYNSFKNHMNQMAKETKNKITWTQKDV